MPKPKERYCVHGHDTHVVGRDAHYRCKECRRIDDRNRDPKRRRAKGIPAKPRYTLEWEAARVQAWLAIVAHDKMIENKCTQQRKKDFDKRYEKLEAAVPTPVDA